MPPSRRLALATCLALAALGVGFVVDGAAAAAEPGPPPGWEAPPLAAPSPKSAVPACCAHDTTCCERQLDLDRATAARVARVVEVRVADLPELVVKTATAGGAPASVALSGAPGVRVVDGEGRPAPWADGPREEVRVVPIGRYGELRWGDGWQGTEPTPFFSPPDQRSLGYGLVRGVWRDTGDARTILSGKIAYTIFDQGEGDEISVDYVKGVLVDRPGVVVARWGHVEAAPIAFGFVHAYRGRPPRDPAPGDAPPDADPAVTFVLPEIVLRFESKDATHEGGIVPSRFSRTAAFTTFTLPVGPGRSGLTSSTVFETGRWFRRPAGAKPIEPATLVLSSSQTSVEAAPRVRVVMFAP